MLDLEKKRNDNLYSGIRVSLRLGVCNRRHLIFLHMLSLGKKYRIIYNLSYVHLDKCL